MEEDLRARLLADTALAALVGNRIVWIDRPQGAALPSVTLQLIVGGRSYNYKGPVGFTGSRVQADIWGVSYGEAKRAARTMPAAIEPAAVQGGTRFAHSFQIADRDMPVEDIAGGTKAYRVLQEYVVWWSPV